MCRAVAQRLPVTLLGCTSTGSPKRKQSPGPRRQAGPLPAAPPSALLVWPLKGACPLHWFVRQLPGVPRPSPPSRGSGQTAAQGLVPRAEGREWGSGWETAFPEHLWGWMCGHQVSGSLHLCRASDALGSTVRWSSQPGLTPCPWGGAGGFVEGVLPGSGPGASPECSVHAGAWVGSRGLGKLELKGQA